MSIHCLRRPGGASLCLIVLVWEPKRVVPTYAVPAEDVAAQIDVVSRPSSNDIVTGVAPMGAPQLAGYRVFDPSVPFAVRTTEGEPVEVRVPVNPLREAAEVTEESHSSLNALTS